MNINIISNNKCCLKLDVLGNYQLSLNSVTGMFNIVLLNSDDYIAFSQREKITGFDEYTTMDYTTLTELINSFEDGILTFNTANNKYSFKYEITDCSIRLKYLLGIKSFPATSSQTMPSFIGSPYLFIKTSDLSSLMRYSWQTSPKNKGPYAYIQNIVSINLNTFTVAYPFSLVGSVFNVDESLLHEINFTITGLYDEEIEFANDIIYNFTLTSTGNIEDNNYESNESSNKSNESNNESNESNESSNEEHSNESEQLTTSIK